MAPEAPLVVILLAGILAMVVLLVRHQRAKEARLADTEHIELPIESTARTVLVILPSIIAGPVVAGIAAAATDPWARNHALLATLGTIALGVAGLFIGLRLSRNFRRVGTLRCSQLNLRLDFDGQRREIDLTQPYELHEATALGPANTRLQVVVITQWHRQCGFSYGLPVRREAYGDCEVDKYPLPLLGAEARVVHERLRVNFHCSAAA